MIISFSLNQSFDGARHEIYYQGRREFAQLPRVSQNRDGISSFQKECGSERVDRQGRLTDQFPRRCLRRISVKKYLYISNEQIVTNIYRRFKIVHGKSWEEKQLKLFGRGAIDGLSTVSPPISRMNVGK